MKYLVIAAALVATSSVSAAGDANRGKALSATCAGCHGENGVSQIKTYPILAGQYASYIEQALKDYKSGARANAIMKGFAAGLSAQDMKDLAAYFASQPSDLDTLPR
ncbi:MAG: cytochrome c [Gammaproteobacteria bacterium]|nr:cytochrome c [Gammaproteobacteria bacterium]